MLTDRVEGHWLAAFIDVFERCKIGRDDSVIILSETQSRALNIQLAELALANLNVCYFHLQLPSPKPEPGPVIRSSGASQALNGQETAVQALASANFIVDLTVEGLMHAPQTPRILKAGARIMTISNEHPEALARLLPTPALKECVKAALARCRDAKQMTVQSAAGTDLGVAMSKAIAVGIWGYTDRPGTLAHWPGGIVVCFPPAQSVNGTLVLQPGDMNLTFKRYIESDVILHIENDFITRIEGRGLDVNLMKAYFESFADVNAYATSHVGWGLNPAARYEALTMYDQRDINGTELRAVAGNFLYSSGANEFAGRFTRGHFDLPMMGCTIALDGAVVVDEGKLVDAAP